MNSVTIRDSLLVKHYHHNADEMKMKRMGDVQHACDKTAYKIPVKKSEGKDHLAKLGVEDRTTIKWILQKQYG